MVTPVKSSRSESPGPLVTPTPLPLTSTNLTSPSGKKERKSSDGQPNGANNISPKSELTPMKVKQSVLGTPKTPTPFKKALAEMERRIGMKYNCPETPSRLAEDIEEFIQKEQEDQSDHYETDSSGPRPPDTKLTLTMTFFKIVINTKNRTHNFLPFMEVEKNLRNATTISQEIDVNEEWGMIKQAINKAVETTVGKKGKAQRSEWFDQECKEKIEERNKARLDMIAKTTRSATEKYRIKRREAGKICRKKKRVFEREKLKRMEEDGECGRIKEFYTAIKLEKRGFQPDMEFCRGKNGELIGDVTEVRKRWVDYFDELLNMGHEETVRDSIVTENERQDNEDYVEVPEKEEVVFFIFQGEDSGYSSKRKGTSVHQGKENTQPHKRARKALASSWTNAYQPTHLSKDVMDGDTSRNSTQTNYRNLTVDDESDAYESCRRLLDETLNMKWEMVACGKTKDQLLLTQLAYKYLTTNDYNNRQMNIQPSSPQ
uniref:Cmyb_C domain-containing protein n=1 Tax=Rhodnius prolixus TaxID=13249 RepID=T1HWW3_RHOPR